jgi:hypothetical protein
MCRLRNMRWRWAPARGLATPKIERMVAGGRQMETLLCGFFDQSCSVKEGVWRSRRSRVGEIIGPLPTDAWFLSRAPDGAPCLRLLRWLYHGEEKAKGQAWVGHVRKRRMGLTMGGNVYSEEARLREAREVQYERQRNRLASETLLTRLRAEHGPEPRCDFHPSCKKRADR